MAGARLTANYDVLQEIFQHLYPFIEVEQLQAPERPSNSKWRTSKPERVSLFQAACASRAISECALDVLWSHLTGLEGLFRVFPSLRRQCATDSNTLRGLVLAGHNAEDDWRRFDGYARRVRILDLAWRQDVFSLEIIAYASSFRNGQPLLPSLQWLRITPQGPFEEVLTALIPPSLSRLDICPPAYPFLQEHIGHNSAVEHILLHAISTCTYLEEVEISTRDAEKKLIALGKCDHLNRLHISRLDRSPDTLDVRLMRNWLCAQSLTRLSLELRPDDPAPSATEALVFPLLQVLVVSGCVSSTMVLFFQHCSTPVLSTLKIVTHMGKTAVQERRDLAECLQVVALGARGRDCFRRFILDYSPPWRTEVIAREMPARLPLVDVARPLCALPQLEMVHLSLQIRWGIVPTDADVKEMVPSWPNLLSLQIDYGSYPTHRDVISYTRRGPSFLDIHAKSLVTIAKHCPKLKDLAVLCGSNGLTAATLESCPVSSHQLQNFMLPDVRGKGWSSKLMRLWVVLIERLFPNLVSIKTFTPRPRREQIMFSSPADSLLSELEYRRRSRETESQDTGLSALERIERPRRDDIVLRP
ncbi:hypothetical protein DAEQUDRAFT_808457 [Daedalea quercina L-15889]|uniref:F-box domain-containing protein n=1 Tax=Daedalea quercina L-15889 TaxID=1314783 RepID=A0A165TFH0_9APHY|nr:hypothetical protein DAEQUDRAFT_808457 [Daedalea quercina L-15889]